MTGGTMLTLVIVTAGKVRVEITVLAGWTLTVVMVTRGSVEVEVMV